MLEFIKRKKIILIAGALVILGIGAIFFFRKEAENKLLGNQTGNSQTSSRETAANGTSEKQDTVLDEEVQDIEDLPVSEDEELDVTGLQDPGENIFAHITSEHCNRDCEAFSDEAAYFEYCKQVCGIAGVAKISNCDGKTGLAKDYCLKDLAVNQKKSSICDGIADENIKKTCKSRILEDALEEQMSGTRGPVE